MNKLVRVYSSIPPCCRMCIGVCVQAAYRVCSQHSDDLRQSHVPQLLCEGPGHQPLCGVEDVVFNHEEPDTHTHTYRQTDRQTPERAGGQTRNLLNE